MKVMPRAAIASTLTTPTMLPSRVPPTNAAIMAFEIGAALTVGNAPERRVGFFAGDDSGLILTADGLALFDAAVAWASHDKVVPGATPTPTPGVNWAKGWAAYQ